MSRQPLSVFVTTYNNADTLARCLDSVAGIAGEIVVLDSGSEDDSRAIAQSRGARVFVEPFKGYGPQKQSALDKTTHRWVLLLDADEALTPQAAEAIERTLADPQAAGYELPRLEWLFWRWPHPRAGASYMLRLFDKTRGRIGSEPIHAAPEVDGPVRRLRAPFLHYGERDLHTKVEKINHYSTGLLADSRPGKQRFLLARMILYPQWVFLRQYFGKRHVLNGAAGFIASVTMAYYAFLKSAKRYEARKKNAAEAPLPPGEGLG